MKGSIVSRRSNGANPGVKCRPERVCSVASTTLFLALVVFHGAAQAILSWTLSKESEIKKVKVRKRAGAKVKEKIRHKDNMDAP
jgi:hypothetical protein